MWRITAPSGEVRQVRSATWFSVNDGQSLLTAAINGLGIAYLPSFLYADAMKGGLVEDVIPDLPRDVQGLHAVYPSGRYTQPKVRALIDFLVEKFGTRDANGLVAAGRTLPSKPGVSFTVIRAARQDGGGAVKLFGQHDSRQHVRPDHGRKRQHRTCPPAQIRVQPVRPADHKGHVARARVARVLPASWRTGEDSDPALIQRDEMRPVRDNPCQKRRLRRGVVALRSSTSCS